MHNSLPIILIARLKDHLQEDLLDLRLGGLAILSDRHRNSCVDHRLQLVVAGYLKSYVHAISPSYFFGPAFRMSKAAMVATLPMTGNRGKRADCVSQTAAECMHSASMQRHSIGADAALSVPHQHSEHAGDVRVGGFFKRFVAQAHSLVEKGFMVHRWIMSGLGLIGHSYFPFGWYVAIVRNMKSNRIQFDLHKVEPT